jgi:hypothetical protein
MLSLMVLFAVVGVAYVLVSSQYRRSAMGPARLEQYAVDYRKQLHEAAMQVFRGPTVYSRAVATTAPPNIPPTIPYNNMSVIGPHSLLEDMYGNDAVASSSMSFTTASTANPVAGGTATPITVKTASIALTSIPSETLTSSQIQLIDLQLTAALPWPLAANPAIYTAAMTAETANGVSSPTGLASPYAGITDANGSAPSGYFNGCVLTFTTGPAAGQSTRIVGYDNGYTTSPNTGTSATNSTGSPTLRVMNFPGATSFVPPPSGGSPATGLGSQFLINGRPFNGVGFGFNFATNLVDAVDYTHPPQSPRLFALLPNPVFFSNTYPAANAGAAYNVAGGIGGADEDYDAADWNNMLLGLALDPRDVTGTLSAGSQSTTINFPPYPSLHRPELVQYWMNTVAAGTTNFSTFLLQTSASGTNSANLALARQMTMRPIGYAGVPNVSSPPNPQIIVDHPNFTGSNSNPNTNTTTAAVGFDPINGPWDVDNDGDGIADSVWVDLGAPVQTAPDGTTYKPLFAIRVLDMDGRLNVNAHGSSAQTENAYTSANPVAAHFPTTAGGSVATLAPNIVASGNTQNPTVGSGYGTADVNLQPLYTEQSAPTSNYQALLAGNATYDGRYGEAGPSPATAPTTAYDSTKEPSGSTPAYAGATNSNDSEKTASALGLVKHWEFPFPGYATMLTAFGSAPDLWGRAFTALDVGGAPVTPMMSGTTLATQFPSTSSTWQGGLGGQYDTLNNPYLLNLSRTTIRGARTTGATDNPFTPAELERLLRGYDSDSGSLAPRLATLLGVTPASPSLTALLRRQVTTDSWDLPSPNFLTANTFSALAHATGQPPSPYPFASSPVDLLELQFLAGGFYGTQAAPGTPDPMLAGGSAVHPAWNNFSIQAQLMLPPELLAGQRFNINRPFGNGRDDDQDGVVDEPDEYYLGEPAWVTPAGGSSSPMLSGNSPFPNNPASTSPPNAINLAVDWNADGTIDANDALMARQIMARHLYVLAMMSVDPTVLFTSGGLSPENQGNSIQYDADGNLGPNPYIYQAEYALAQWAINCVDFLDRDSTMTPFEFDIKPFDGWGVDGVLDDGTGMLSKDDVSISAVVYTNSFGQRGLVWGCERPELLITETLAWHDRRTQDLSTPGGTVNQGDPDFDQALLPMPACFIELYNPWTTQYSNLSTATGEQLNAPAATEVAGEFYYDTNTASASYPSYAPYGAGSTNYPKAQQPAGVVLNKLDAQNHASPVWRLIFVNNGLGGSQGGPPAGASPDPRTLDPDDPFALVPATSSIAYTVAQYTDRIVYFVAPQGGGTYPAGPPNATNPWAVYYPSATQPATLKPGRYAVVGSAGGDQYDTAGGVAASKLGRNTGNTGDSANPAQPIVKDTGARRIVLTPSTKTEPAASPVSVYFSGQAAEPLPIGTGPAAVQNPIAVAIDTAFTSASATAGPRNFGISDPVIGYSGASGATNFNTAGEPQLAAVQNQPLDAASGDQQMMTNATLPGYRTVHLQRLANPQIPWNAITNPYLTIDSASVDVTAFNGVSPTQDPAAGTQNYAFCSTQRGDQYFGTAPAWLSQQNLLWAREFSHTAAGVLSQAQGNVASSQFTPVLYHSLGYLNQQYGSSSASPVSIYTTSSAPTKAYAGMPTTPFSWLTWNNRPYTTPLELALVPKSRSSRLLTDYSASPPTNAAVPASVMLYNSQSGGIVLNPNAPGTGGATPIAAAGATTPFFGHLLNFFDSASPMPGNLYRIFEYLQVPSRFVGTETVLNPVEANFGIVNSTENPPKTAGTPAVVTPTLLKGDQTPGATPPSWMTGGTPANLPYTLGSNALGTYLAPPLNKVSEYRDPGRVNPNTVQDAVVWQGVLNGLPYPELAPANSSDTMSPNVAATMITKANSSTTLAIGFGATVPTNMPSYFTNPFRSFGGAVLTNSIYASQQFNPLPSEESPVYPYTNGTNVFPNTYALTDIDATLLRPAQIGNTGSTALFDAQAFTTGTNNYYNDPTRNPYFRIQNASRMSNLLTTRSNVYAVWITVGYFQVTPWYGVAVNSGVATYKTAPNPVVYDTAHQDGYQLGQELGNESGQIKRHRAFYLFDRTIPVGFERGVDHNVQNAILLRRFIE